MGEILLGVSLALLTKYTVPTGFLTAFFFVMIFPGNISQFVTHTSAFGLDSDVSRGVRLFSQPVLIAWALWSSGASVVLRRCGSRPDVTCRR